MIRLSKKMVSFMVLCYGFLYLPISILMLFSFNDSKLITSWTGFSLRWYRELWHDEAIISALVLSLKIAVTTATLAVLIGTTASIVMVRFRQFTGRRFFHNLVTAPLVMPDVMTGLALLLFFVACQQTFGFPVTRGVHTITIGHTTIAIAYVILIVRARLFEMDRSLEEAALDLGARPLKVFISITLPIILPSILSGWLLAFTLSLDDVVLASFLSGPGSTTLPMVVFSSLKFGISPVINALATLIVLFVAVSVLVAGFSMYHGSRNVQDR